MKNNSRSLLGYIHILLLSLIVVPGVVIASTPDAFVAVRYVQANLQSDFDTAFKLTHPEAQQRMISGAEFFAKCLDLLKRQNTTDQTKFMISLIKGIYGTDDPKTIRSLTGPDLYRQYRQAISISTNGSDVPIEIYRNAKVAYIGLVQESPSLAHVIVAITYKFPDEEIIIRDSVRLKSLGDGWLVDGSASSNLNDYFADLARLSFKSQGIVLP